MATETNQGDNILFKKSRRKGFNVSPPLALDENEFDVLALKVRRKGRASAADWVLADVKNSLYGQDQIKFDNAVRECAEEYFSNDCGNTDIVEATK